MRRILCVYTWYVIFFSTSWWWEIIILKASIRSHFAGVAGVAEAATLTRAVLVAVAGVAVVAEAGVVGRQVAAPRVLHTLGGHGWVQTLVDVWGNGFADYSYWIETPEKQNLRTRDFVLFFLLK